MISAARGWGNGIMAGVIALMMSQSSAPATTLAALWQGQARFEQVGELDWGRPDGSALPEQAGWLTVHKGIWYVFNRAAVKKPWINANRIIHALLCGKVAIREKAGQRQM